MATFAFETITAQQALAIGPQDVVTFKRGADRAVSLAYNIPVTGTPTVTITVGDRIVEFGPSVLDVSERGGLVFSGRGPVGRTTSAATSDLNTTAA